MKVFTATTTKDRRILGDRVTEWIAARPGLVVHMATVTASSDLAYHCLSITVFAAAPERALAPEVTAPKPA